MKILVVGGGGREHAIVKAISKSERVDKIYCVPGNAGIAAQAECVPIKDTQIDKLLEFVKEKGIDLKEPVFTHERLLNAILRVKEAAVC